MHPQAEAIFYVAALICLAVAAAHPQAGPGRLWAAPLRWLAAGVAFALVPAMWNAAQAGW